MSKSRAIRALIIFTIGFLLWWNKLAIYQFIDGVISPSSIEWKEYSLNLKSDYRVIRRTEKSLKMISVKNDSASLDIFEYDTKPASSEASVASICKLKGCFHIENSTVEITGLKVETTKGKYKQESEVRIIEFISLPNTNVQVKIESPEAYHENLRAIISNMKRSSANKVGLMQK